MYDRSYWQDHVTTLSGRYDITENGDGTYSIVPAGEVMQQGTPQDQVHFNNLEIGVTDVHTAVLMMLNFARQQGWAIEDINAYLQTHNIVETGTVTLTNTQEFPFNNSKQTVALTHTQQSVNYVVIADVSAFVGNVGEVEVSDRLVNGFKLAFTGSASSVTVKYIVIGGFNE